LNKNGTRYAVRGTRQEFEVRGTRCAVRGVKFLITFVYRAN